MSQATSTSVSGNVTIAGDRSGPPWLPWAVAGALVLVIVWLNRH